MLPSAAEMPLRVVLVGTMLQGRREGPVNSKRVDSGVSIVADN